jgi:hypothetical protein
MPTALSLVVQALPILPLVVMLYAVFRSGRSWSQPGITAQRVGLLVSIPIHGLMIASQVCLATCGIRGSYLGGRLSYSHLMLIGSLVVTIGMMTFACGFLVHTNQEKR